MIFDAALVKSIKADINKGTMTLSFEVRFNAENLTTCNELSAYADEDAGTVKLSIIPRQMAMRLEALGKTEPEA
jgi:hypothetical protein